MAKVFLGGTTSNSLWREELIPKLEIDFFNPVVEKWTKEVKIKEDYEKEHSDFNLYVITRSYSMYSIAEAVDDSNKKPSKTIFCAFSEKMPNGKDSFSFSNLKRLDEIGKIVEENGGKYFKNLDDVATFLNSNK